MHLSWADRAPAGGQLGQMVVAIQATPTLVRVACSQMLKCVIDRTWCALALLVRGTLPVTVLHSTLQLSRSSTKQAIACS